MASTRERQRTTGSGRKLIKNRREGITNRKKPDAVLHFATSQSATKTIAAHFFHLNDHATVQKRKMLHKWRAMRTELERRYAKPRLAKSMYVRSMGVGTILSAEAEQDIVCWINMLQKDGVPGSSKMLSLKALEVAAEWKTSGLKATWHWRSSFKKRHNLVIRARTRQGQVAPDDANAAAERFGTEGGS